MSERMKWREAEAVVRAYRAEHGATDVDIATLARALGTDEAEVRRLAGRKRRFSDASGALSAVIACVVVMVSLLFAGPSLFKKHPLMAGLLPATRPMRIDLREPEFAVRLHRAALKRIAQQHALMKAKQLAITIENEPL